MSALDAQIRTLFDKFNTRKAKVEELESQIAKSWITNCTYRITGATVPINLNTTTQETLLDIVGDLVNRRTNLQEAAKLLDIKPSDKINGYAFDAWIDDCKKRLASINLREEKKALEDLEGRLNSVLSPEERRRIEVEALLASI